jgi:hypothetical protein
MNSPRKAMAILVSVLALLMPTSASAGQPDSVDPAIMQPALNPSFAPWDCWRTGIGIVCDGARALAWEGAETGFVCDGGPSIRRERTIARCDDSATKTGSRCTRRARRYPETLSSPGWLRADPQGIATSNTSSTPSRDLSRGRTHRPTTVTGAGVGLVIHDVGIKAFDIDDNVLLLTAAPGPRRLRRRS